MTYDQAEALADRMGYDVRQRRMDYYDGFIKGKQIYIEEGMTQAKKTDVLIEELVHGAVTVGDILDQDDVSNRKQEHLARKLTYEIRVPLIDIARCVRNGRTNLNEIAEEMNVDEETLRDALSEYKSHFGARTVVGNYIIQFIPYLYVYELSGME